MSPQYPEELRALPPPIGITPGYDNPTSIALRFQAGFGVCVGISGLFVITRTYTRLRVMRRWGLEDCEYHNEAEFGVLIPG